MRIFSGVGLAAGGLALLMSSNAYAQVGGVQEEQVQPRHQMEMEEFEFEESERPLPTEQEMMREQQRRQRMLEQEAPEATQPDRRTYRRTQIYEPSEPYGAPRYGEMDVYERDPMGVVFSVGGGIGGYTDGRLRDFTNDLGGVWEARIAAGTRNILGFEAAYVGAAQGIDAIGLDPNATLLSTILEANLRLNLSPETAFQPYVIAGAGWQRFDLTNEDFNTSSVRNTDNTLQIPLGVGLAYRFNPIVLDLRGTFRPVVAGANLVDVGADDTIQQHSWTTTLRAGWEF